MSRSIAVLSDIHGNASAFTAVLADIKNRGISEIICIGDIIGYGPEPEACIDLAAEYCTVCLSGNHEYAINHGAEGFNPVAKGAVDYVRELLSPDSDKDKDKMRRWDFINNLETGYYDADFCAMHGSPRHEVMEYVLPSDPEMDPLKIDDIFDSMEKKIAFVGHTHYPGIVEEETDIFLSTLDIDDIYVFEDGVKAIVNVGSVGQPRDRDIRACYVEYNGSEAAFRRVEYDVHDTVKKIRDSGGRLHESLGLRLLEGR
ncbi:MAG: metallophosphoesterase family protein [Planctomycetota bacterium]|jgi:predicted phosphodiesterase